MEIPIISSTIHIDLDECITEFEKHQEFFFKYIELKQKAKDIIYLNLNNQKYKVQFIFGYVYLKLSEAATNTKATLVRTSADPSVNDVGWKLHISIEPLEKNMERAWQILQWVASKYELTYVKIIAYEKLKSVKTGEQICIYLHKNNHLSHEQLVKLLLTIEELFRHYEITPSEKPLCDRSISGSQYIYYRNDKNPYYFNSEQPTATPYISQEKAYKYASEYKVATHNPIGGPDKLQNIHLDLQVRSNASAEDKPPAQYHHSTSNYGLY